MDYSIYINDYLNLDYRNKQIKTKDEVKKLIKKKFLGIPTSEFGIRSEVYEYINTDDIKMGFEISGGCVIFLKNEFVITDGTSRKYNIFPIAEFKNLKIVRDGLFSDSVMLNNKRVGNFNRQSIQPFNQIQSDIILNMFSKIKSDQKMNQIKSKSSPIEYYLSNDQKTKKGPFSLVQLKKQNLNNKTLIWNENLDDWTPVSEISELKNLITKDKLESKNSRNPLPPPPPPPIISKSKQPKTAIKASKSTSTNSKSKKVVSTKNKSSLIKELDSDLKQLQLELEKQERKDSMYSGGIIKAQVRQLIASLKLNINYLQTAQLLVYLNSGENLSKSQISNLNKLLNSNKKSIDSDLNHNKRFTGALISANNEQLNLCSSVINLNKVLISKLSNQKSSLNESQLKKSISQGEKLSAKYSPCLVKSNIDMRVVIDCISLNTIRLFEDIKISDKELKAAVKKDEKEIAKYKPSLFPILLSTRKVTNQILLINSNACTQSEVSKIKSTNTKEMQKITKEIKKYAPSTFKYLLAIQNEYCEYLNDL